MSVLVSLEGVSKTYRSSGVASPVLQGINLSIAACEFVALMGPSGCGKSTLLNLLGLIDVADAGRIVLAGNEVTRLNEHALTLLRREVVGYVSQFFNLLPTLTLLENVQLPLTLLGRSHRVAKQAAADLLGEVGLTAQRDKFPYQVSGGQMQRVAIARAVIHNPPLLLADEPTGNLDSHNGEAILELFRTLVRERGLTVLMATHSSEAASVCDRRLHMQDGRFLGASEARA